MKVRKKPVEVEAFQMTPARIDSKVTADWPLWLVEGWGKRTVYGAYGTCYVKTLEGDMRVNPGDYIIRGVQGELYPCKPDVFEMTYDRVEHEDNDRARV